ncbi:hypothetical protein ACFVVX_06840 [Kitasatospora sp. NPDC058170]|uniref:hypothetical protein n=1 Tax=Kitasatospora sp. NPDC058170 TaxID=3346364 RepID=UPI0036DB7127
MATPHRTVVRAGRLLSAVLMVTTLGACMSSGPAPGASPTPGKDDPLPVKSRDEAEDWARQFVAHLAQVADIQINDEPVQSLFTSCVGRNGEVASDGRFTFRYAVHSNVPNAQHNEVVRKVRDLLTGEGLKITDYREMPDHSPESLVFARHPVSNYHVDVSSTAGNDRMALGVNTPCLMPPS